MRWIAKKLLALAVNIIAATYGICHRNENAKKKEKQTEVVYQEDSKGTVHYFDDCNKINGSLVPLKKGDKPWKHNICKKCGDRNRKELSNSIGNAIAGMIAFTIAHEAIKEIEAETEVEA